MGIRGLYSFLQHRHPTTRRSCLLSRYTDQTWAVDGTNILYIAVANGLDPVTVFASLVVRLRRARVTPIVVFDGRPPADKAPVLEERRQVRTRALDEIQRIDSELAEGATEIRRGECESRRNVLVRKAPSVTRDVRDGIKSFLHAAGVLFVTANGEADDLLAHLATSTSVHAVLSADSDMLVRGVPVLIVPETADTTVLSVLELDGVLRAVGMTFDTFARACGPVGPGPVGPTGLLSVTDFLSERQRDKWTAGPHATEPETLATLATVHGWPRDWVCSLT